MVYKEQARDCVNQMSPWTSDLEEQKSIYNATYLIEIIKKISDIKYVVQCCVSAIPPDITQTRELLVYARNLIFKHSNILENSDELQTRVCHCIQRLDTLEIISDNTSTEQWLEFYQADLLETCVNYLQVVRILYPVLYILIIGYFIFF